MRSREQEESEMDIVGGRKGEENVGISMGSVNFYAGQDRELKDGLVIIRLRFLL